MTLIPRSSLFFFLLILCGGCWERKPNPPPPVVSTTVPAPASPEQTPRQILEKMVAAYKSAMSYADHGSVRLIGELTQPESEPTSWPCTVAFRAPGNLRLEVNEGMLVSDGIDVFAQIRRLFGQVLKFPTPEKWTLDVLFKDVYLDEAMNLVFPKEIIAFPPQVVLLFADDPLKTFMPEGAVTERLAPLSIGQTPCNLVQITHRDTKRVLWIHRDTGALLRLDYLVEGLPLPPGVESIRLIRIDMSDAVFNATISSDAFEMEQPVGAMQVDEFRPFETILLGQVIQSPQNIVLSRLPLKETDKTDSISLADLSNKIVVFCFWMTNEYSRDALIEMQKVVDTLATNEQIRFFAVNLDSLQSDSELQPQITKALSDWALSIAVDRPMDMSALDELGIDSLPSLLIVGPDGRIEFYYRGIVPAATLGRVIRDIQDGGSPHKEGLAFFEREKAEYRKRLESMVADGCFATLPPQDEQSPPQTVAPLRLPTTLTLTERWKLQTLKSPGNIVVLPESDGTPPSLLLSCEGNSLAMLDIDGNVLKKEKPACLQNDELLNLVRVADIGKRFIGVSSIGGRSIHILDETFQTVFTYPSKKQEEVVADFRLVDLHGNGTPALLFGLLSRNGAGTASNDSLSVVDLQGCELWRDETILSPFQVGTFSKAGRLEIVAIHAKPQQETLLRFNIQGKQLGEPVVDGDWQIRWFACADLNGDGNSEIGTVLVSSADGRSQVAELDEQGKILWSVPIPSGEHQTSIEQLVVGDMDGDGIAEWIVPTVDGSILFIDQSGKVVDSFSTGQTLSGIAVLSWKNRRLLVVADAETVTAWEIGLR